MTQQWIACDCGRTVDATGVRLLDKVTCGCGARVPVTPARMRTDGRAVARPDRPFVVAEALDQDALPAHDPDLDLDAIAKRMSDGLAALFVWVVTGPVLFIACAALIGIPAAGPLSGWLRGRSSDFHDVGLFVMGLLMLDLSALLSVALCKTTRVGAFLARVRDAELRHTQGLRVLAWWMCGLALNGLAALFSAFVLVTSPSERAASALLLLTALAGIGVIVGAVALAGGAKALGERAD